MPNRPNQTVPDLSSLPTKTVTFEFTAHNGNSEKPVVLPANTRIMYVHKDDGAIVITSTSKLRDWSKVVAYRVITKANFRNFINSMNSRAHNY